MNEPVDASMGPQLDSCGKLPEIDPVLGEVYTLQWGRNLTVAERCGRIDLDGQGRASMGPQLDSCGKREATAL